MDLSRFIRIVRRRWLLVMMLVVLGLVAAAFTAHRQNQEISSSFEAMAVVSYPQDPLDATNQALATRLEEARARAVAANSSEMSEISGAQILPVADLGELQFLARGPSEAEARENALTLRSNFLEQETAGAAGGVEEELTSIVDDIIELETELNLLTSPSHEEELIEAERTTISEQLTALRQLATQLRVELVQESERSEAEIAADLADAEEQIESLVEELVALPEPTAEERARQDLQVRLLERQITALENRYQELFLRQEGIESDITVGRVQVVDRTPSPRSLASVGLLGAVIGGAVAIGILLLLDRFNPRVWGQRDVSSLSVIAEVPSRRPNAEDTVWYETTTRDRRKLSIQQLRTAVEGRASGAGTLGVVGVDLDGCDVSSLAADLAVAIAISGRSVILVETDFDHQCELHEFSVAGTDLATMGRQLLGDIDNLGGWLRERISAIPEIRPGLRAIPAGSGIDNAADVLAGREFATILHVAEELADLVILSGPQVGGPAGRTVLQRTDIGLLVVPEGQVRSVDLELLVADLPSRRVDVLGVALMVDPPIEARFAELIDRSMSHTFPSRRAGDADPTTEMGSDLDHAEGSGDRESEGPPDLSEQISLAGIESESLEDDETKDNQPGITGDGLIDLRAQSQPVSALLSELKALTPDEGRVVAQRFLLDSIELLMENPDTRLGEGWEYVSEVGIVPLRYMGFAPTVRHLLVHEMGASIREIAGREAWNELGRLLVGNSVEAEGQAVDHWIENSFFANHLERTNGEPTVWHLKSEAGEVQVLVHAKKFGSKRISTFRTDVLIPYIESLSRRSHRAPIGPDGESVGLLQKFHVLEDVRQFDRHLRNLVQSGVEDGSAEWYPWLSGGEAEGGWFFDPSRGIRPALAPLQRLGLLALPVLDEVEMEIFEPPA